MLIQRFAPLCGAALTLLAWPDDAQASVRFCFEHDSTFTDSGQERTPSCTTDGTCEDLWTVDQPHAARGILASITKNGSTHWSYTEDSGSLTGCTDSFVPSGGDSGWYTVRVYSLANVEGRYVVSGNLNGSVANSAWSVYRSGSGTSTHTFSGSPGQSFAQFNVLSAASEAVSVIPTGPDLDIRVAPETACDGNCYLRDDETVNIQTDNDGHLTKYIIAHEIGHAVMHDTLGAGWTSNCAGFSTGGANCQSNGSHAMTSKEHSSCALSEGFAHFYAASVWNNDTDNDCWFTYWSPDNTPVSCELGSATYPVKYLENQCLQSWSGKGVELDWMRALWDYYQDPSPSPRPDFDDVLDFVDAAPAWTTSDAWESMEDAAVTMSTVTRWNTAGTRNGIDH